MSMRERMGASMLATLGFQGGSLLMSLTQTKEAGKNFNNQVDLMNALVDAALNALLEPTDTMMEEVLDATAGDPVSVCEGVMDTKDMFLVAHQTMIRAAKEGK